MTEKKIEIIDNDMTRDDDVELGKYLEFDTIDSLVSKLEGDIKFEDIDSEDFCDSILNNMERIISTKTQQQKEVDEFIDKIRQVSPAIPKMDRKNLERIKPEASDTVFSYIETARISKEPNTELISQLGSIFFKSQRLETDDHELEKDLLDRMLNKQITGETTDFYDGILFDDEQEIVQDISQDALILSGNGLSEILDSRTFEKLAKRSKDALNNRLKTTNHIKNNTKKTLTFELEGKQVSMKPFCSLDPSSVLQLTKPIRNALLKDDILYGYMSSEILDFCCDKDIQLIKDHASFRIQEYEIKTTDMDIWDKASKLLEDHELYEEYLDKLYDEYKGKFTNGRTIGKESELMVIHDSIEVLDMSRVAMRLLYEKFPLKAVK